MNEMPQPLVFFVTYRFEPAQISRTGAPRDCPAEMYETLSRPGTG